MLFDDKIVSPSGASYCLTNGMPEQWPAFYQIPTFNVVENGGKNYIYIPVDDLNSRHEVKKA